MAGLNINITGNNRQFMEMLEQTRRGVRATQQLIEESGLGIDKVLEMLKGGLATLGVGLGVQQLMNLAKEIATVRGEFQQLEIAFSTMLGSTERASRLMDQVTEFAATTPNDLGQVANGVKQLLAYGSEAEEVVSEMRMLGDIAAGLSIPLGDIVYLFGTTRTQGRLYTQDLRQFMGRGIPLAEELARQFGVAKEEVGELVTAGRVGFEEVNTALRAMTSEGGKFYQLMAQQSKSITGQLSNLGDSVQQMFNEIGTHLEGVISSAIGLASSAVDNYQRIGKVIADLVAAYGAYRTALVVVTAIRNQHLLSIYEQNKALRLSLLEELAEIKTTLRNNL